MENVANELATTTATAMAKLDDDLNGFTMIAPNKNQRFTQSAMLALTIQKVKTTLSDRMMAEVFLPIKGNALGFLTDESPSKTYSVDQVRTALIEAVLLGAMPIGNEFNILSGRAYLTKNCLHRLVREFPGLSNLVIKPNYPRTVNGGSVVDMAATWKLNGAAMAAERTGDQAIPVRVNAGQGADAILGKAYRKFYAYILLVLTGVEVPEGEVNSDDLKSVDSTVVDLTSAGISAESTPRQSAAQTMAEKMKNAKVTRTKIEPAQEDLPTPAAAQEPPEDPPAAAEPEPPAAAESAPVTETPKLSAESAKLLKVAEKSLADAAASGIAVSASMPVIMDGKVMHRNLNPDGTLRAITTASPAAPAAATPAGAPTTGTPVNGKKRKIIGYVNGVAQYEDEKKAAATKSTTQAAPTQTKATPEKTAPAAAQPAAAAPAATAGKQGIGIVAPPENTTGEVEEMISTIVAVNNPKIKTADGSEKIRYRIVDEKSAIYFCGSKPLAQKANEFKEKKKRVRITYYQHQSDYWLQDVEEFVEEAAPQQGDPMPADGEGEADPFDTEVEGSDANQEL